MADWGSAGEQKIEEHKQNEGGLLGGGGLLGLGLDLGFDLDANG